MNWLLSGTVAIFNWEEGREKEEEEEERGRVREGGKENCEISLYILNTAASDFSLTIVSPSPHHVKVNERSCKYLLENHLNAFCTIQWYLIVRNGSTWIATAEFLSERERERDQCMRGRIEVEEEEEEEDITHLCLTCTDDMLPSAVTLGPNDSNEPSWTYPMGSLHRFK